MKTPSDDLYQLIKSLDGQEKRYLKIYASRHIIGEGNKYMLLFDEIDKQKEYDEAAIKQKFRKHAFIKQLTVMKAYLYDLVLKSLDAYNSENSVDNQLRRYLHYTEILFDKALYEQCEKILFKVEKLAQEHERLHIMLEIVSWKLRIIKNAYFHKTTGEEIDGLYNQQHSTISGIENYNTYERLNNLMLQKVLRKGWFTRSEEEIKKEYTPIINNDAYNSESEAISLKAKILFHNTQSIYYYLKGDTRKSDIHSKKILEIFEKNPAMIESNSDDYISGLNNIIYSSIRIGDFNEAGELIGKLKSINPKSLGLRAKIVGAAYLPEMIIYNSSGRMEEAIAMIPEIEKLISGYGKYMTQRDILYLYYNCACIYFKTGDFKKTSHYLVRILNSPDIMMLPDVHANARILNLMVQYELEEFELLPYILRSTYRFLLKQERLHMFEKNVIGFIRRLTDVPRSGVVPLFKQLQDELSKLSANNPYEKYVMEYFGFTDWLASKIQKVPIAEIMQKNKQWNWK